MLWSGRWTVDPQSNDSHSIMSSDAALLDRQRFISAADHSCEPAHPLLLSPVRQMRGRVTDATEHHASQRLRGLQGKLWLMIGTSIDHLIVRDHCADFGAQRRMSDAAPTTLHPAPGMHFDYCHLPPPLSLTIVYVGYKGLTALEVQANVSLQRRRFAEIHAHLHGTFGVNGTADVSPDFVSFSGVEWDFKQWGLQHRQPSTLDDWLGIRASLDTQLRAAQRTWPGIRARFLRSQFQTAYRWYRDWKDVDGSEYARYTSTMHSLATGGCGGVQVLDLARIVNCSHKIHGDADSGNRSDDAYGVCSKATGWTTDGLHPAPWVMRAYLGLALNVLADVGEACGARRR